MIKLTDLEWREIERKTFAEETLNNVITPVEAIEIVIESGKGKPPLSLIRHHLKNNTIKSRRSGKAWLIWKPSFLDWLSGYPHKPGQKKKPPS